MLVREANKIPASVSNFQKDRFRALNSLASELVQGNYRAKDKVKQK